MKKTLLAVLLGVLLVFSFTGGASATLIGDVVNISHTPYKTSDVTVTADASDLWNLSSVYTVDVNSESISINFLQGFSFQTGKDVLTISGLDTPLLGVNSTYSKTSFGSDWVSFDFAGTVASGLYVAALTFESQPGGGGNTMNNPIPAPILLLGTGLVGMAGFRRRIKK